MDDILKDGRFTKLMHDPRYRQIPKTERKVKIDKRFQSMFDGEKFKVKYTVDKRGKPVNQSSSENLRKYYDLSSDEEESDSDESEGNDEKVHSQSNVEVVGKFVRPPSENLDDEDVTNDKAEVKNDELDRGDLPKDIRKKLRDLDTDYARGEGVLLTDSSSDEESSEAEEEDDLEHAWGELDANAETCEDATNRLAVCNMDWDNIKASDLFVLFNSFLQPGGLINSVTIYPSDFGLKRMKEEEIRGPIELTKTKIEDDDAESDQDENEEGSKYHMEKLRQYQLNRLKYYYAVVVFDSASTANKVYSDCDGTEYESSATKLDLRFIPDDVTFDQEVHEECTEVPEASRYKPRLFTTTALQQAKVELTWDAANPHRKEFLKGAADGEINDEDLKNYLACSSSDEDSNIESGEEQDKEIEENIDNIKADPISKYKALLQEIEETDKKKKNRGVEMEITWGLGLKEKTQELVKKKLNKVDKMTPFEEMVDKQKEKKKAKKLERKKKNMEFKNNEESDVDAYSSDDIPSDIDMNDPYFAEEFNTDEFKKKKNKKSLKNKSDIELDEGEERKRAELELLLDDDEDNKAHFSLRKIQEAENETKTKRRRQKHKAKEMIQNTAIPEFEVNVNDNRFSALFTSHHYNIDPTDPNFKKTKAMETLIQEKLKRRPVESAVDDEIEYKKPKKDAAMTVLINSIKRKSTSFNNNK